MNSSLTHPNSIMIIKCVNQKILIKMGCRYISGGGTQYDQNLDFPGPFHLFHQLYWQDVMSNIKNVLLCLEVVPSKRSSNAKLLF